MTPAELAAFRSAFRQAIALTDERGFSYFAGWHGIPFNWCEHHNEWFLPWHRAYLYGLELALQRLVPGVTLPWWDWTREATIPTAYREPRSADGSPNPLAGAEIVVFRSGVSRGPTTRRPGASPGIPPLPYADAYETALAAPSFTEFSRQIEAIHDDVHVWVGGTMANVATAGYDPLFYAHHTMIDRAWRIWQHRNPGGLPPQAILDQPFRRGGPGGLTPRQVLDVKQLGYDYAASSATVGGTR